MNTTRTREPQETRSGRELQAEKRAALAAIRNGSIKDHELTSLARDAHALWELAVALHHLKHEYTHLRRRFRSKVYPAPELAEFGNHVLDLFVTLPEMSSSRGLGAGFSAFNALEKMQIERGIETEFSYKGRITRTSVDEEELVGKMTDFNKRMHEEFEAIEDALETQPVGQPVGPSPREVERALHSIQIMTEQQEDAL